MPSPKTVCGCGFKPFAPMDCLKPMLVYILTYHTLKVAAVRSSLFGLKSSAVFSISLNASSRFLA